MRQIKTLVKKEMLDILRDKKTLIMMVVVPVLLYPLILIGMTMAMSMIMQSQEETVHTVAYEVKGVHAEADISEELERLYEENQEALDWQMEFVPTEEAGESAVRLVISENASQLHAEITYASSSQDDRYTMQALEEILELYRKELVLVNLESQGLAEEFLYPITYEAVDQSSATENTRSLSQERICAGTSVCATL